MSVNYERRRDALAASIAEQCARLDATLFTYTDVCAALGRERGLDGTGAPLHRARVLRDLQDVLQVLLPSAKFPAVQTQRMRAKVARGLRFGGVD